MFDVPSEVNVFSYSNYIMKLTTFETPVSRTDVVTVFKSMDVPQYVVSVFEVCFSEMVSKSTAVGFAYTSPSSSPSNW